ncbi:HEAT repeat domain-containing protein [Pseudodesulfovibrio senegalensis]|uniref:HEAT repeat domain-containing protein n=1 Tax=Pseudodesulfovibrio senegalensis TaxID=1721087 RepID=A0A6N6N0C2_9BACT|nr:HEAT repeat domain-containing protein [Pseudodesulfovibrio senegalensis]KAB1440365.1 HEAT repeat domain-containing protein [Pseudodesulfovibrio senegalensis]
MTECNEYLVLLKSEDMEIVREGAFKAGEAGCVEAVPELARLLTADHLGIQEAAESSLRRIGGKAVVQAVIPMLRSDSAPVRNLSMDILREVGHQDVNSLIELLHDDDADIRIFASDILGSSQSLMGVEALCEALLKDPEVNVRYQAAVSLGDLGREEAAVSLNKAMEDDEWVQYAVIEALTKIKHASSVDALVKALDKASDLVASMIIDALGEMGNVKAVTMLLRRMEDSPTALRNKIVKAVVNILGGKSLTLLTNDEREKFRQYLLVALKDEDEEIQDAAIQGLAYVGGEQAARGILSIAAKLDQDRDQDRLAQIIANLSKIGLTEALKDAVASDDKDLAQVAVQALALVAEDSADEVCSIFMDVFWDLGLYVQRQLISVLADVAGDGATDFFVDVLERHDDGTVLKGAVGFLGVKMRKADVVDRIFPLLDHQYDDVKEAALEALISINGSEVRERFVAMASSQEPIQRLMAVYALGKIGEPENIVQLEMALEDELPDIRKVAVEAIAQLCEGTCGWAPHVLGRLEDENKDVRLTAVEILGNCYEKEYLPHLLKALKDDDDWVQIRAIDALGTQREEEAVPELLELLESSNRFVVMKVIEALGRIGGTVAFRSLLEISDSDEYELVRAAEDAITMIQEGQEN